MIETLREVIDLSLSVLGYHYWEYKLQLRDEWYFLSDDEFNEYHISWCQKMLRRGTIFVSGYLPDFLEEIAHDNLVKDLEGMNSQR